jgi:hypothetical protein
MIDAIKVGIVDGMEEWAVQVDEKEVDGIDVRSSKMTFLGVCWVYTDLWGLLGLRIEILFPIK